MIWTPDDRAVLGAFILAIALVLSWFTEPSWYRAAIAWLARHTYRRSAWIRFLQRKRVGLNALPAFVWSVTVGTWFTRRRISGGFGSRRYKAHRICNPDEHSRGLMVARRDLTAGWWT